MTHRRKRVLWTLAILLILAALATRVLLKPENLAPRLLNYAGKSLGLELTATGIAEYRLRGTPQLVVRKLVAREPGAKTDLLRAERVLVSLPWSTLRARGQDLTATRIELDAPVLDVAAFQHWQSTRPPSDTPLPTLTRGIGIVRGSVIGSGWKIENLDADLQSLATDRPVRLHLRGRYVGGALVAPVDLHIALTQPASDAGIGIVGAVALEGANWRIPSQTTLSARLVNDQGLWLRNAVLGASSQYIAGGSSSPLAFGIAGPVQFADGGMRLNPAGLAIRGQESMPTLDAQGSFSLHETLQLQLQGALAEWPSAWPALPPPLGQSRSPISFTLGYEGANDLSDVATLGLQRDDTRFAGRFRLFELIDWINASATDSPVPPLAGTLHTPKLEISGAVLEGVEVEIEDDLLPSVTPAQ